MFKCFDLKEVTGSLGNQSDDQTSLRSR